MITRFLRQKIGCRSGSGLALTVVTEL